MTNAYDLFKVLATLPPLYSQENEADPMVKAKLFTPMSSFTWYLTEAREDGLCFGFASSHICPEGEFGYVDLNELSGLEIMGMKAVEIDLYFSPTPLSKIKAELSA